MRKSIIFIMSVFLIFVIQFPVMCKELQFCYQIGLIDQKVTQFVQMDLSNIFLEKIAPFGGLEVIKFDVKSHLITGNIDIRLEPEIDKVGFPFAIKDDILIIADIYNNKVIIKDKFGQKVISGDFGWNGGKENGLKNLSKLNVLEIVQDYLWIYSIKENKLYKYSLEGNILNEYMLFEKIRELGLQEFKLLNNDEILLMTDYKIFKMNLHNGKYKKIYAGNLLSMDVTKEKEVIVLENKVNKKDKFSKVTIIGTKDRKHYQMLPVVTLINLKKRKNEQILKLEKDGFVKIVYEEDKVLILNVVDAKFRIYEFKD